MNLMNMLCTLLSNSREVIIRRRNDLDIRTCAIHTQGSQDIHELLGRGRIMLSTSTFVRSGEPQ